MAQQRSGPTTKWPNNEETQRRNGPTTKRPTDKIAYRPAYQSAHSLTKQPTDQNSSLQQIPTRTVLSSSYWPEQFSLAATDQNSSLQQLLTRTVLSSSYWPEQFPPAAVAELCLQTWHIKGVRPVACDPIDVNTHFWAEYTSIRCEWAVLASWS